MSATQAPAIPARMEDLTPEFLTQVVRTCHPGATVESFAMSEVRRFGEVMVSTSDRFKLTLAYAPGTADGLPTQVAVKANRTGGSNLGELYGTEVDFYVRLRPELAIEAPRVVGGLCDRQTSDYYLLLEDLTPRNPLFPNVLRDNSLDQVRSVLDQFALLHATFWESARLASDLSWYQRHDAGSLAHRMDSILEATVARLIAAEPFKADLIDQLGTTATWLHAGYKALMRYQATLPQTIVHGDGHIGNTYLLPSGQAGLLDFQLTSRGAWCHDVSYLIATALPIETRRREERDLLRYYLERLSAHGVATVPDWDTAWTELGRAFLWGFYVGWLPTPIGNYGEEINVENLRRTATAFVDHGTKDLITAIL